MSENWKTLSWCKSIWNILETSSATKPSQILTMTLQIRTMTDLFWSVCILIKDTLSTQVPVEVSNNQSNQYETTIFSDWTSERGNLSSTRVSDWYSRWTVLQDESCGGKRLKLQVLPSPCSRGKLRTWGHIRGRIQVLLQLFLWTLHKRGQRLSETWTCLS